MPTDVSSRFKAEVTANLELLEPALVEVLRQLVRYDYPEEVVSVDFEVFTDRFTREFPVRAFFMDQTNSEHFVEADDKCEYPSPVDPRLLPVAPVYDEELEARFLAEDDGLNAFTLAGEALIPWFFECWQRAGGSTFGRGASIMLHGRSRCFDLVRGDWRDAG